MYTLEEWITWAKANRVEGSDSRVINSETQHDYYIGDQVLSFDLGRDAYKLSKENEENLPSAYNKIGPYLSEILDNKMGRIRYQERMPSFFPLTKRVIDILGCVYNKTPVRNFKFKQGEKELSEAESEKIVKFLEKILPYNAECIDALFSKIERYSLLQGVAGVLIEYDKYGGSDKIENISYSKGKMILTPLLAHRLFVARGDNGEILAINYVYNNEDYGISQYNSYSRVITADWDILYSVKYDASSSPYSSNNSEEFVDASPNPLGFIPVVFMNDELYPDTDNFWGHGLGEGLVRLNRTLNDYLAQEQSLIRDQTQMKLFGINIDHIPEGSNATGAFVLLKDKSPDGGARIEKIAPTADIAGVRQSIDALFKRCAYSYSLPVEVLQTNSSKAIAEARGELKPHYLNSQKRCKVFEHQFWDVYFKVASVYATSYFKNSNITFDDIIVDYASWPVQNLTEMVDLARFLIIDSGLNASQTPLTTPTYALKMILDLSETETNKIHADSVKFYKKFLEEINNGRQQGIPSNRDGGTGFERDAQNSNSVSGNGQDSSVINRNDGQGEPNKN